jgi:hypothetical protein
MEIEMELATVFSEPVLRRYWLLRKALEHAPLDEALRLARAADEFLCVDPTNAQAPANGEALKALGFGFPSASNEGFHQGSQSAATITVPQPDQAEHGIGYASTIGHIVDVGDGFKDVGAVEKGPQEDAPNTACVEDVRDDPDDVKPPVAMTSGLAVLAGMEDIVRYLRQQDDVVVSAGTAAYLVNGRFQLNSEELLARANKIRQRQGKPQFQRIPYGFPTSNGGDGAGRGQDRT